MDSALRFRNWLCHPQVHGIGNLPHFSSIQQISTESSVRPASKKSTIFPLFVSQTSAPSHILKFESGSSDTKLLSFLLLTFTYKRSTISLLFRATNSSRTSNAAGMRLSLSHPVPTNGPITLYSSICRSSRPLPQTRRPGLQKFTQFGSRQQFGAH
jgi:hypothetical protein